MASGIDIEDKPRRIIDGMISAQLDINLIEYHKLMATLSMQGNNAQKANEHMESLRDLIFLKDDTVVPIEAKITKLLDEMDNWVVRILPESIPMPQDKLILKPEF